MNLEPIDPEHALELYLDHRRNEVARATLQSHRSRLKHFIEWCVDEEIDNLNDLTGRTLYEYRVWRKNDGNLTKVSVKTQMATLRVFVRWLETIEGVEPDLHTKIQLPSLADTDDSRDIMLEAEQAEAILDYLYKYHYASARHVIALLAWHTAMRRGAIHALDLQDYDRENQFIEVIYRPETPIKNQDKGERYIALDGEVCIVLDDWIADKRPDVTDDQGRDPLVTSRYGRFQPSSIQKVIYDITRPCQYTDGCPHGRDLESCEAAPMESASRCPSSRSPHAIRRGAITHWLKNDIPKEAVGDRANVGLDVLDKHYDQRNQRDKMEQRRNFFR